MTLFDKKSRYLEKGSIMGALADYVLGSPEKEKQKTKKYETRVIAWIGISEKALNAMEDPSVDDVLRIVTSLASNLPEEK